VGCADGHSFYLCWQKTVFFKKMKKTCCISGGIILVWGAETGGSSQGGIEP